MKAIQKIFVQSQKKCVAVLIDPDKHSAASLKKTIGVADRCGVDFFLIGGSLVSTFLDSTIKTIKSYSSKPVVLFPGSLLQLSPFADAILLLSLISGRNPDFLIGNHVIAAPFLKRSKLDVIPAGYMLIDGDSSTSVQYMSNTQPIPAGKNDIAVATAIAGEMLGLQVIYLETGSGAKHHVPTGMITAVKNNIQIPLMVGGGIKTRKQLTSIFKAGADIAVLGNALEGNPEILADIMV